MMAKQIHIFFAHIDLIYNSLFAHISCTIIIYHKFFIAYMFGAHPEHIWLIYLVEGFYMIPRKFYNMWNAKPMNQALYYLDFCVRIV